MAEAEAEEISCCRVCGSTALSEVLDLGHMAVSDFIDNREPLYAPLTLVICDPAADGCCFVQLKHKAVKRDILYQNYWYRSATNESMQVALADITTSAENLIHPQPGDVVLDIGANDGTLLRSYRRNGLQRIGVEPAANLQAELSVDADVVIPEFFSAEAFRRHVGPTARAVVITSIAVFYDLEQPHEFVRDIAAILAPGGVWIVQMAYMPTMYTMNNFDNVCHEHVGYYSLAVMDRLVRAHHLEIRDVELNAVNGGSFRLYIGHRDESSDKWSRPGGDQRVSSLTADEQQMGLDDLRTYEQFAERLTRLRQEIRGFVLSELANGRVFHIYGASTKGNTLLQFLELDHRHFALAAERSRQKWGLRTVGTRIPIVSEEECRLAGPDYFFVLPWHFKESFISREREFLSLGGRLLFPLPWPSVVQLVDGELQEWPISEFQR